MSKLAERYARAARSAHLKVEPEQGDIDVVIAAGHATDRLDTQLNWLYGTTPSLGVLLLRCMFEWDRQRAAMEKQEKNLRADEEAARVTALREGRPVIEAVLDAANEALTTRALILVSMPSIRPCARALGNHATNRALKRSLTLQPHEIARAAGNALDIWLDQRCNTCAGTKETGIYGGPRAICNKCRGTGIRRRVLPSKSSEELALGEWLMAEADRLVAAAQRKMSQALR